MMSTLQKQAHHRSTECQIADFSQFWEDMPLLRCMNLDRVSFSNTPKILHLKGRCMESEYGEQNHDYIFSKTMFLSILIG